MESSGFWSRLAAWFRGDGTESAPPPSPFAEPPRSPEAPASVLTRDRAGSSLNSAAVDGLETSRVRTGESGLSDGARNGLHGAIEALGRQLAAHSQRSDSLLVALERLAEGLERLPEVAQTEVGLLGRIGEDASEGVEGIVRLGRAMDALTPLARETREAVLALVEQSASTRRSQEQFAATLDGVRVALQRLHDTAQTTNARLAAMQGHAETAHNRMMLLLERQGDRLRWFCLVAVALGGIALWLAAL